MEKQDQHTGPMFSAGRPIGDADGDELALNPLATELASAIHRRSPAEGFVIGIEGQWGSGKSSLTNLLERAMTADPSRRYRVVRFSPWLVGSREQLLGELFAHLITAAADLGPPPPAKWCDIGHRWRSFRLWWRLRRLKAEQRQWLAVFGEFAERLGQLGPVATALGVAEPVSSAVLGLSSVVGQAARSRPPRSLPEIKSQIDTALRSLGGRLVVIIDDVDRLEPAEAAEIVRLVRAVADFQSVTYVLCYDRDVLACALQSKLHVANGDEFLQKVIQLPFRVPNPETFRLRVWFSRALTRMFEKELLSLQSEAHKDASDRLATTLDVLGGRYIRTPRDIVNTLNVLTLQIPVLAGRVDLPDLIWLGIVRHGNPALFRWIERYLAEAAAVANKAIISEAERAKFSEELEKILLESESDNIDIDRRMYELAEILPGLHREVLPTSKWKCFEQISRQTLAPQIAERRLGSPDHFREYFALTHPQGSIPASEVSTFAQELAESPQSAKETFAQASKELMVGQIVKAERLLDQIMVTHRLSETQLKSLAGCIVHAMDAAAEVAPIDLAMRTSIWRSGEVTLRAICAKLSPNSQDHLVKDLFVTGPSLGFLMDLFRHETFAHGVYGDRPKPETEWLLNKNQFEEISTILRNRLMNTTPENLLRVPELLSLMFGWKQVGGDQEAITKVSEIVKTDEQLVSFLFACRGVAARNGRLLRPLRRKELENFLDVSAIEKRLATLTESAPSESLKSRAKQLVEALKQGESSFG